MITAVDTNVLLDIFGADPSFGPHSKGALDVCTDEGSLVACEVVWAEIVAAFPSPEVARENMERLDVGFDPMGQEAALMAGQQWAAYRRRGGPRTRIVPDFLVGAHALAQADRLLTRDARFHRRYFTPLTILDPSQP